MRIPTGNFGNVTPQAQQTRVAVSNVGDVGNAVSGFGAAVGQVAEQVQRDQGQSRRSGHAGYSDRSGS